MSETKKRTSKDIENENINLQLKAGGIQYTIRQYTRELDMVNDRMRDLAIEYNTLKAQEAAEESLRKEIEEKLKEAGKPKLEVVPPSVETKKPKKGKKSKDQNPQGVDQATTQDDSGAVPTPPQEGSNEQGQKKE